ncbi:protein SCAI [Battus philenor]|uniref:protein SCAI n=1 Tax=Battus philenor TaxID=42288 RepID=UPI0035CEC58E
MNPLEDHERKVIIEFCHLLEKSKQLFNGLRELPQYGHKQWHSYFGRTFDVYTKLWKFQQQHRGILDNKYGLKRWQIGEIASKIGQLYYHFYLRTSETGYLSEAYSFYCAIRGRSYYTQACKEDKCELMVKKLRYYARFIVVCLLLKKLILVRDLIKELDKQIIEYGKTYDPEDQIEWTVVMDEVKAFIVAEAAVAVLHPDNYPIVLSHRLNVLSIPPPERPTPTSLTLQEAIIVGSISQQVKFSELTMDMYRILQTLEWEPTGEMPQVYNESPRHRFSTPQMSKGYNAENLGRHENPHKYLLYKPSAAQVLVYLASGCFDLPSNGALLLYISADSLIVPPSKQPEDVGYEVGGLVTNVKTDLYRDREREAKPGPFRIKDPQCIHPGDLFPFTRCPLFLIIDSDNSYIFQNMPRHFGQPLLVLMSPLEIPSTFPREKEGSLFTLFLHSPLSAFCYCCDIKTIPLIKWERSQSYVETFIIEAAQVLMRHRIDPTFIAFMADDFLRLFVLRYMFCAVSLRMHRGFRSRTHLPRSSPSLPDDLLEHPALVHIIMDLASHLQVRSHFHDSSGPGPSNN